MRLLFRRNKKIFLAIDFGTINGRFEQTQAALRLLMPIIMTNVDDDDNKNEEDHGQQHQQQQKIEAISLINGSEYQHAFFNTYPSVFFNARLLHIWEFISASDIEHIVRWLFTRRADGQPRIFVFHIWIHTNMELQLKAKIQERFTDPTRQYAASPLFVRICTGHGELWPNAVFEPMSIDNDGTGERLTIRTVKYGQKYYELITNSAIDANAGWLAKKRREVLSWNYYTQPRCIDLCLQTEIGLLNAEDERLLQENEEGSV